MHSSKHDIKECWVCGESHVRLVKEGDIKSGLTSDHFAITNADYGMTGDMYACQSCGFHMCHIEGDVVSFYEDLEDESYESTRTERAIQEQSVVDLIKKHKSSGNILDIGAGSGIMVECALAEGFEAEGVEPSKWLQSKARERDLPVHLGIYPHEALEGRQFDAITLVDVIEHVDDPVGLLQHINQGLKSDGILIMVTPDRKSFMASLLGKKWWHYRVAHIGYFDKKTLDLAAERAGFSLVRRLRPSWYFKMDYLVERLHKYLPRFLRWNLPRVINQRVVPVNLRDSWLGVYKLNSADD